MRSISSWGLGRMGYEVVHGLDGYPEVGWLKARRRSGEYLDKVDKARYHSACVHLKREEEKV